MGPGLRLPSPQFAAWIFEDAAVSFFLQSCGDGLAFAILGLNSRSRSTLILTAPSSVSSSKRPEKSQNRRTFAVCHRALVVSHLRLGYNEVLARRGRSLA